MALMQWSDAMFKGAFPSRKAPAPLYDPTTTVSISLAADELEAILTQHRHFQDEETPSPVGDDGRRGRASNWTLRSGVPSSCRCAGRKVMEQWSRKQLLRIATRIANQLAEALGIGPPICGQMRCPKP